MERNAAFRERYLLSDINFSLEKFFLFLIILSASFDKIFTIEISGMTIRLAHLLIVVAAVLLIRTGIRLPRYISCLLIWLLLQLLFSFRSSNLTYSLGYFAWTALSVLLIILIYSFVDTRKKTDWLLKVYIRSFVVLSVVGLIQWALGFFGIPFFLTNETFNDVQVPRINGFCFEPSYYATYLIPGWIVIMCLWEKGSDLFSKREIIAYAVIISMALFLSTSRMGWICMAAWLGIRGIIQLKAFTTGRIRHRQFGFLAMMIIGMIGVALLAIFFISRNGFDFIISGLGIFGSSDHSSSARLGQFTNTIKVFLDSPIIGWSLGGVPVRYCELAAMPFDSGAPICIWIELLAASGLTGIIPFAVWFGSVLNLAKFRRKRRYHGSREYKALLCGLIFECIMLAMNQNALRVYFWVLLGVIIVAARQYSKREGNETV